MNSTDKVEFIPLRRMCIAYAILPWPRDKVDWSIDAYEFLERGSGTLLQRYEARPIFTEGLPTAWTPRCQERLLYCNIYKIFHILVDLNMVERGWRAINEDGLLQFCCTGGYSKNDSPELWLGSERFWMRIREEERKFNEMFEGVAGDTKDFVVTL